MARYINYADSSSDTLFRSTRWIMRLKIADYQIIFILWNLLLLAVPYFCVRLLDYIWHSLENAWWRKPAVGLIGFVWLVFIPNTAYLMSEGRHLLSFCPSDSPFDICEQKAWVVMFYFIYALVGWVSYVYLTSQMRDLLVKRYGNAARFIFPLLIIPLISLGFLLGLINRWNSWEIFLYPVTFFSTLINYLVEGVYFTNWLIYTIFLYILYWGGVLFFKPWKQP